MRRLLPTLLATLGALALLPTTALGQEATEVRLTLLSQTPWNSSFDAENGRELLLSFRAENLGATTFDELSIGVTLFGRVVSRSAYEASLSVDPSFALRAETFPRDDSLAPGQVRDFAITFPLDSPGLDPDDSGVYPLKVDLRSGFTSLAAIRTAVIFLVRQPEVPMDLSWTFVLHHPIAFGPDGAFTSTELEDALAPGGLLAAQIRALLGLATDPALPLVDVAITPTLLTQLGRMRDGYLITTETGTREVPEGEGGAELARLAIEQIGEVARAPNVRVTALPFSAPELPSLVSGGLGRDVGVQVQRGREIVGTFLQTTAVTSVLRPPGAALDDQTLETLPGLGVSTLVAGPATVSPSPQPLGFAGPPTARLGPDGDVVAIVPEPGIMTLLQSPTSLADPVLAAQIALGELAAIWQEQPGVERGVAIVVSEDLALPPPFYGAFSRAIASAPWVSPMHAGDFALRYPPAEISPLAAPAPRRFATTYVAELRQARRRVEIYRSMLVEPSPLPEEYDTMLLLAESRQYLADPVDGLAFITSVRDSVGAVFEAITVDSVDEITLTSSTGSGIPVTVGNTADQALRVTVQLVSQSLAGEPSIDLELAPGASQTVTFEVEAQRTGRFTVAIRALTPGGRPLDEESLTVRSTVYNRIALVITIAAALVLLALWARRLLPRRTS